MEKNPQPHLVSTKTSKNKTNNHADNSAVNMHLARIADAGIPPTLISATHLLAPQGATSIAVLESEKHLVNPQIGSMEIEGVVADHAHNNDESENNSCFYSCCPVECCRCVTLSQNCGGCFSSSPSMPGGGCCECLGLSPSAGMLISKNNMPPSLSGKALGCFPAMAFPSWCCCCC